jgi:sporulation integral membrane protein YtvI
MTSSFFSKALRWAAVIVFLWLGGKYILPLIAPFLLGLLLALAAEPGIRLCTGRFKWKRAPAAGLAVSLSLLLVLGAAYTVGALAVRQLGVVASALPDLQQSLGQGMEVLEDYLLDMASKTPSGIRDALTGTVTDTFDGGGIIVQGLSGKIPGVLTSFVGWLSGSLLTLGVAVFSAYLIAVRLPDIRRGIGRLLPDSWQEKVLPALKRAKVTLFSWLKAQLKMSAVMFTLLCGGFLLLNVPYAPFWAVLVALVDAVPVLGTGTVLLPWALVSFLQGDIIQAAGLLAIFALAWMTRALLEPRIVGKQLGLDPLGTLISFYVGFKLWGILGMILAPMLAATGKSLFDGPKSSKIIHKENT